MYRRIVCLLFGCRRRTSMWLFVRDDVLSAMCNLHTLFSFLLLLLCGFCRWKFSVFTAQKIMPHFHRCGSLGNTYCGLGLRVWKSCERRAFKRHFCHKTDWRGGITLLIIKKIQIKNENRAEERSRGENAKCVFDERTNCGCAGAVMCHGRAEISMENENCNVIVGDWIRLSSRTP